MMHILSSCSSFSRPLLEPLSALTSKTAEIASSIKGRLIQTLVSLNSYYGFTRPQWIEITQIALRALAPFVAALFVIIAFPQVVAQVLLPPVVIGVVFLSAFYGLPDKQLTPEESEFDFHESSHFDEF